MKCWFHMFVYCSVIIIVALANTSVMSHSYYLFLVVRTVSNFEVCNTVLLLIIAMLCIGYPGLTYWLQVCSPLMTCPGSAPHIPHTLVNHSVLNFYKLGFSGFHLWVIPYGICFSLAYLSAVPSVHTRPCKWEALLLSRGCITFHCVSVPQFFSSFIDRHLDCFHILPIVNNATVNMGEQVSFSVSCFHFLWIYN